MHRNAEDLETQKSCIVSLELVQATPLKDALLPDGRAKVIVSADRSATVHVSPEFEKMYGYLWSEIAGRTLGFITGPNTNMALLRRLLNSARNGHSESAPFFTNNRAGDEILTVIQVKPVVDGGVVSHMMVVCSIVGDIAGHCLHDQTNDREWGTDELHVERLVEMSYHKPSDTHTPLSSSHTDDFWGWEALQLRMDLRKQVCPPRTKRSHSSPSLVAPESSDAYSPASARKPSPPDYSPSRLKPTCKAKSIKVSSGNRFYAEVIRQRLKERNAQEAQDAHALARDLPIRDENLPVEKGEALGVPSGFARVPSSIMFIRTQSAEIDSALYQLTLTRCRRLSTGILLKPS
jgi:PAS domain S-box-containing protein